MTYPVSRTANSLDLTQFAGGALQEKIDIEVGKIARNLRDPGTKPDTKRKIVIELSFTTDEDRELIQTETSVRTTLAPLKGVNTKMLLGVSPTGEPVLKELITKPALSGSHEIIEHEGSTQPKGFNKF